MHDPADDPPIVHPLDTPHISRQMRLDPTPLLIAQPKQVRPHHPIPQTNQVDMESILSCYRSKIIGFWP
jgi:hypothetical protein